MDYRLKIESPAGSWELPLDLGRLTMGRHSSNDLVLTDDLSSRNHCAFEVTENSVRVQDLQSRNGTFVNEAKINIVELAPGDVVRVGRTRMTLAVIGAPPAPAAPPARTPRPGASSGAAPGVTARAVPGAALGAGTRVFTDEGQEMEKAHASNPLEQLPLVEDAAAQQHGGPSALVSESDPSAAQMFHKTIVEAYPMTNAAEADVTLINSRGQQLRKEQDQRGKNAKNQEGDDTYQTLRNLLVYSARTKASDVHIEPKSDAYTIRMRMDGMMVETGKLPTPLGNRLNRAVKVLCDIDINQSASVQDGHFTALHTTRKVDYRISFTPAMHGQKLVIRVLDPINAPTKLDDLNMPAWMLDQVKRVARQDQGMLLVCGPTGSGKTSTLYAVLRSINTSTRNVITIEDPVEYEIEGVTQFPIDAQRGNTFDGLLRSILRQDPDVILVGEIRDGETARTALQAAMTGHLVLSTVHVKDTIGAIFRLLDLGAEPNLVASSLNIVIAQRLVRMLCPYCKRARKTTPPEVKKIGARAEPVRQVWEPAGCKRCLNLGYTGRRGIFELLNVSNEMRDAILTSPTLETLRKGVERTMFVSLRHAGYQLAVDGITSIEEIERVAGSEM